MQPSSEKKLLLGTDPDFQVNSCLKEPCVKHALFWSKVSEFALAVILLGYATTNPTCEHRAFLIGSGVTLMGIFAIKTIFFPCRSPTSPTVDV